MAAGGLEAADAPEANAALATAARLLELALGLGPALAVGLCGGGANDAPPNETGAVACRVSKSTAAEAANTLFDATLRALAEVSGGR